MSHFIRTAAEVIGAVVAIAAAIPSGGTSLLAYGLGVSASTAAFIAIGTEVAVTAFEALTAPKPPKAVGNPMAWQSDPQAAFPHVMGRCYAGGQIVYRQAYGGDDKNETLITVYSSGPIKQFESLYVDGVATAVAGTVADINDRGKMYVSTQLGLQPEPAQLGALGPPDITTASRLSGLAASSITFVYDSKGGKTFTTEPACGYVILGTPVYDPRKDDTYPGGSGPQRWNDETTWSFDGYDNPFLKGLSYLMGYRQNGKLVIGVGRPIGSILVDQFVDGANVADANGWTLGGTILSTDSKWQRLNDILASGSGVPLRHGASIGCMVDTPRVSLATIEDADIIGDWSVQATQSRRDRINAVVPRYMAEQSVTISDTTRKPNSSGVYPLKTVVTWGLAAAAPIVVDHYVTFDGGQRQKGVDFPFVTGVETDNNAPNQVAQLARYQIENAREIGPITLPLKPRWMGFQPGDVLTCGATMTEQGLVGKDILILNRERDPETMTVTMTARSETAAKHPFALGQTTLAPATPSISLPAVIPSPQPGDWAVAGGTISSAGGSLPALIVIGASASSVIDGIVIETRPHVAGEADDANWSNSVVLAPAATQLDIANVAPGSSYDVSVSYRWLSNTGDRLILGPAIPGVLSTSSGAHYLNTQSVAYPIASDDDSITIATFSGVTDDGRSLTFPAGLITGLASGSAFYVFWNAASSTYAAVASPALTQMADSTLIYLGTQATSTAGSYPAPTTPPPGHVEGGCPVEDALVLLANDTRDGPGGAIRAGDLEPGRHWVWAPHEHDLGGDWGAWPVTAKRLLASEIWSADGRPDTSPSHLWAVSGGWTRMDRIGRFSRLGEVVSLTIGNAHTYALIGDDGALLVSHNKLAPGPDE